MSALMNRLNNVNGLIDDNGDSIKFLSNENGTIAMYSIEGANFQEWALNRLDYKGSIAHKMIGSLVTAINNNQISVAEAENQYCAALSN